MPSKSENKTIATKGSVEKFLSSVKDPQKLADCQTVIEIMKQITKEEPVMWGSSQVGFGTYHYKYESGREGDFFITGFSPRAQALTIYIMSGFERFPVLMQALGKYKTGKSCLYVKKLEDIDLAVLKKLIKEAVAYLKKNYM
jgi:hypothetical protein